MPTLWDDHMREAVRVDVASEGEKRTGGVVGVRMSVRVLSSSSSGNCSVVTVTRGRSGERSHFLVDAGLSPARTRRLMDESGIDLKEVRGILYTHLDADHCHAGWVSALPAGAWMRVHRTHQRRARTIGLDRRKITAFDGEAFEIAEGVVVTPVMMAHDGLGVAAFRFESGSGSLGYATDCGRVTRGLVETLKWVDALAIESNYCPFMQESSGRPEFLKRRIMGGAGHLSNQECAKAVRHIKPREHVVLLHLSRQCNTPERASEHHAEAGYGLTVAMHDRATEEIGVGGKKASGIGQ